MKRRRMNGNDSKKIRRTGRAGRIGLCIMLCVLLSALQGMTVPAAAPYRELKGANGRGIYVLLPEDYDDSKEYPSVYFMPKNGYSAQQYIYDDIAGRIRELENAGTIMDMVCVFPELDDSGTPQEQIEAVIGTVQDEYAVSEDASQRGVIGTGTGGYLAFYLGFGLGDGKPDEEPAYFSAIASHDGDFTSKSNPYVEPCGDIYGALDDPVSLQPSVSAQWLRNYYIYIDSNSDSALAFADGGSNDIAQLFRADSLTDHGSASAWDYSVFEYSTRTSAHYGTYLDNLERSLNRFSLAFGMEPEQETEAETEPGIRETVSKGEGRLIDLSGEWHFITQKAMEEDPAAAGAAPANEISAVMEADWESWERVVPGLDWWSADFAECLEGNQYYAGYVWYVRAFDVPDDFEMEDLQVRLGMIDEADEAYLNGVRIGATGIPDEGGAYDRTNPWDVDRIYPVPEGLLKTGTNVLAVRVCNSSGAGGWYTGPIRIEAKQVQPEDPAAAKLLYYTETMTSDALKEQEIEYRVLLPDGYYDSGLRYPVVYMLHGYGSTGKSFEIEGVTQLLQEGMASGRIPACIVIFPTDGHPQKSSWWAGAYANMLNEDLVAEVDRTLRTVDDRQYRYLAGESMGGGGAYLNAVNHPEQYGGVLDLYGALSYSGSLIKLMKMGADELSQLKQYVICGNHDMYGFDIEHLMLEKHLKALRIPHVFEIDNGEHSSSFFLPYLEEGFTYLLSGAQPLPEEGQGE